MIRDKQKILKLQNISICYKDQPLLRDISFSLAQGEILCLLGPSGSGKTTLLRILAGLEKEDTGTIYFHGQDIMAISPHKRNFGMMFQEYALFPHKTVWQNIAFGLEMRHFPADKLHEQTLAMLNLVGLLELQHRTIDALSGGERQRVALARTLAPKPQLLLLDEPLGSLDRTLRDRLTDELRVILKSLDVITIFVTHDQVEAFSIADKVAILHHGTLQQFDKSKTLYRKPKNRAVAQFLGFHNLIDGEVDEDGNFISSLGTIRLGGMASRQKQATLLIRPEGARLIDPQLTPPDSPYLSGTVINQRFHGSIYRLSVRVNQCRLIFDLAIETKPPRAEQPICLALKPSALVLLEEH